MSSQDRTGKQRPLWQEVVLKTEEVSINTSRYQISHESVSELKIKIAVCLQTNAGKISFALRLSVECFSHHNIISARFPPQVTLRLPLLLLISTPRAAGVRWCRGAFFD